MSKWSEEFKNNFKTIGKLREETRKILKENGKLAMEKYHNSKSLKRLKEQLKKEAQ